MKPTKHYWAYAVQEGRAVLVRCQTHLDAAEEKERLKNSAARTVGTSRTAALECEMRNYCLSRGWEVDMVR